MTSTLPSTTTPSEPSINCTRKYRIADPLCGQIPIDSKVISGSTGYTCPAGYLVWVFQCKIWKWNLSFSRISLALSRPHGATLEDRISTGVHPLPHGLSTIRRRITDSLSRPHRISRASLPLRPRKLCPYIQDQEEMVEYVWDTRLARATFLDTAMPFSSGIPSDASVDSLGTTSNCSEEISSSLSRFVLREDGLSLQEEQWWMERSRRCGVNRMEVYEPEFSIIQIFCLCS